jgi:hypothetical protein
MDILKMLADLHEQRDQIDHVIVVFERLAAGHGKRRGRPPAWMKEAEEKKRGRPPGSKNKPKSEGA